MKKLSTLNGKTLRTALFVLGFLCVSVSATANKEWYYYYDEFHAYPSGAGKIYVSSNQNLDPATIGADEWYTDWETSFCQYGLGTWSAYFYTQPAEGWIPYGVAKGVRANELSEWEIETDEDGNVVISKQDTDPLWMNQASEIHNATDSMAAVNMAPLFPDVCSYLVFSHVVPHVAEGLSGFGSVKASKTVNEIGDNIELIATPQDERCHFSHWVRKSDGQKFTENPLPVTVSGAEEYYAYFDADSLVTIEAPEGKYFVWYDDVYHYASGPGDYEFRAFRLDSLSNDSILPLTQSTGVYAGVPHIVYVKGTLYLYSSPNASLFNNFSNSLGQWSGENGVAEADLDAGITYYVPDLEQRCFVVHTGAIEPNTMYLPIPTSSFAGDAPARLVWSKDDAIETAIAPAQVQRARQDGRVYTIGGTQVTAPGHDGIYIVNGKKYIHKSK